MPRIPTYQPERIQTGRAWRGAGTLAVPEAPPSLKLTPSAFTADSEALIEGAGEMQKAFLETAKVMRKARVVSEYANESTRMISRLAEYEGGLPERQDFDAFDEGFQGVVSEIRAGWDDRDLDPAVRQRLELTLQEKAAKAAVRVKGEAWKKEIQWGRASYDERLFEYENLFGKVGEDQRAELVGRVRAETDQIVQAGYMNPEEGVLNVQRFLRSADRIRAGEAIIEDPGSFDPHAFEHLTGADRLTFQEEARARFESQEREREREVAKAREIEVKRLERDWRDHVASIEETGVGMPGLQDRAEALLTEDGFQQFLDETVRAKKLHYNLREIRKLPPAEAAARVEAFRPAPGSRDFEAEWSVYEDLRSAFQENLKALTDDPAAYVASVTPGLETKEDLLVAQDAMGVPPWRRRVLTKAQAQETTLAIQDLPPQDRPAAIRELQKETGKHFDLAYRQLVDEGLDASTQVMTAVLDDPSTLRWMTTAAAAGRKQLTEAIGDNTQVAAAKEAVRAELEDYQETVMAFSWDDRTVKRFNELAGAVTDMALLETSRGKDPAAAAREAVDAVILQKYHSLGGGFFSGPLDRARIPADVNRDQVEEIATAALEVLDAEQLDLPEKDRSRYIKAIREDAYFVTKPDDSGLVLFFNGAPVLRKDGGFVDFAFPGRRFEIR